MTEPQTSSIVPPERPRFQFSLRTLLLLFEVLGSSLAVFGAWGISVFVLVVGLALAGYLHKVKILSPPVAYLALVVLWLMASLRFADVHGRIRR
jgi:hypothetical protein